MNHSPISRPNAIRGVDRKFYEKAEPSPSRSPIETEGKKGIQTRAFRRPYIAKVCRLFPSSLSLVRIKSGEDIVGVSFEQREPLLVILQLWSKKLCSLVKRLRFFFYRNPLFSLQTFAFLMKQ